MKKLIPIMLGGPFLCNPAMGANELMNQIYTTNINQITYGDYTINNGDVCLDASGYTGSMDNQKSIINTLNGAVNVNIREGNTLTIKGFNRNPNEYGSVLNAYKRGNLSGTMSFTGGDVIVSNEVDYTYTQISGLYAHSGGKFDFKSNGDNKINLSVLMPGLSSGHQSGIVISGNSELTFNGGNFSVFIRGIGDYYNRPVMTGLRVGGGGIMDVKADSVSVDVIYGLALQMVGNSSVVKFDADSILLKGTAGIFSESTRNSNIIEFTGNTYIESVAREENEYNDGNTVSYGGQAINISSTELTFNSNNRVIIIGENLTSSGTSLDPNRPGTPESERLYPYWLRTISLMDESVLVSNADLSISSNGGYHNTGLYVWESQAQLNGKTSIVMKNGVDTTRAVYVYDGDAGTSKAEFNDDLLISLADTQASYIAGIEAAAGGKVDVKKGLILNDNSDIYWSLYSRGANSQIDVNSLGGGVVQVVGDIGAINGGAINMMMDNVNSYLTAASYTSTSGSTSRGTVNMDISNQAVWNMTGNSKVTSLTLDQGHVNFMAPSGSGAFKTLTVHGDYVGSGLLTMNTALGGDDSATDKLIVEGSTTTGTTGLIVNNYNGTGAQTANGIEIITVAGTSDGVFELRNRVVAGAYEYSVAKSGNNWYLVNTFTPPSPEPEPEEEDGGTKVIRPETGAYIANLAAANTLFATRLHDRLGETQYTDYLTGETKVTSMWLRQEGGYNRSRTQSGQTKTQANRYVVQIGGDVAQWSSDGLDRLHMGVMAGYGHVQGNTHAKYTDYRAKNKVDGYALGLYGTWYANQADKSGLYVDSWVQYAWFDNTVQGDGLAKESYDSQGWLASVETGYSFKMGENERSSYWLQPKAQLTWMGIHADKHYEANGTKVTGVGDNLSTRLGLRAYAQGHSGVDDRTGRVFQPFVEANWIYNSKNFGVTMNDAFDYQAGTRNIGELKVGVEGYLNKNLNVWGSVAQQVGGEGYSDTLAIVGVKYSF